MYRRLAWLARQEPTWRCNHDRLAAGEPYEVSGSLAGGRTTGRRQGPKQQLLLRRGQEREHRLPWIGKNVTRSHRVPNYF
jgi:hypothetical protein